MRDGNTSMVPGFSFVKGGGNVADR